MKSALDLLEALAALPASERPDWLYIAFESLSQPGPAQGLAESTCDQVRETRQLKRFALNLQRQSALRIILAHRLRCLTAQRRARTLLASIGPFHAPGQLLSQTAERLVHRVLPPAFDDACLFDILKQAMQYSRSPRWPRLTREADWEPVVRQILIAMRDEDVDFSHLRREAYAALEILAHQLAGIGVHREWLRYDPLSNQHESALVTQAREISVWVDSVEVDPTQPGAANDRLAHAMVLLDHCDQMLERIHQLAQHQGTSVTLTALIHQGRSMTRRIRDLAMLVQTRDIEALTPIVSRVWVEMLRNCEETTGVLALWKNATRTLALRITEHASHSGEHYMAQNRKEYWAMARSALGAGPIVACMALVKFQIAKAGLAPVWDWLASGVNYAIGFLLIHFLHFTLATKQPAMTAAKVAAVPRETLVDAVAQVTRTQLIAIIGNLSLAVPAGFLVAWWWQQSQGTPVLSPDKAVRLFQSLDPIGSGTLIYAAMAGVCLFTAGIFSGYAANRSLYSKVPERIAASGWLIRLIGMRAAQRHANYMQRHMAAIVGNVSLGFLLPLVSLVGTLTGLAADVRHVTLAASTLGFGWMGLNLTEVASQLPVKEIILAAVAIPLIGLVNLCTSFGLTFMVAMRARRANSGPEALPSGGTMRQVLKTLVRRPGYFLLPPPHRELGAQS